MVVAIALYFALADDLDVDACLLGFHKIESPMKIQKHVMDFLVSKLEYQSTSKKACSLRGKPEITFDAKKDMP